MKHKSIVIIMLVILITITTACAGNKPLNELPVIDEPKHEQSAESSESQESPELPHEQEHDDENKLTDADNDEAVPEILLPPETDSNGIIIAIDPGHQRNGNYTQERIGPGASHTKPMVSSGTTGVATKIPEYEFTLEISLQLRDELISRGYEVFMIRETHDVDISNSTRAEMAAESGASVFIRIHANGSNDSSVNGILTISPTSHTPFIPALYSRSRALSQCVLDGMIETTGAKNRGIWETDTMTGINWSKIPVTIVELGFMTNPDEDRLMQTPEYQQKLVEGMANGIDFFFIFEFGD